MHIYTAYTRRWKGKALTKAYTYVCMLKSWTFQRSFLVKSFAADLLQSPRVEVQRDLYLTDRPHSGEWLDHEKGRSKGQKCCWELHNAKGVMTCQVKRQVKTHTSRSRDPQPEIRTKKDMTQVQRRSIEWRNDHKRSWDEGCERVM